MGIKYIGMDVHKEATVIAVIHGDGKLVMESVIETKASTILQFIQGLHGELHVTFEEGTWATALNTGMRYSEIRLLQWRQVDFSGRFVTVGKSKTQAGAGRAIPLNAKILNILEMWAAHFPEREPDHHVFPFEKYGARGSEDSFGFTAGAPAYDTDPTRPIGDWKKAWEKAKERAGAILAGGPSKLQSAKLDHSRPTAGAQADETWSIEGGRAVSPRP